MADEPLNLLADSAAGMTAAEAERRRKAERETRLPAPAVNIDPSNADRLARRERLRAALKNTMDSRTARPEYREWLTDPSNVAAVGEESDRIARIADDAETLRVVSYGAKDNFIGRALVRTGSAAFALQALSPERQLTSAVTGRPSQQEQIARSMAELYGDIQDPWVGELAGALTDAWRDSDTTLEGMGAVTRALLTEGAENPTGVLSLLGEELVSAGLLAPVGGGTGQALSRAAGPLRRVVNSVMGRFGGRAVTEGGEAAVGAALRGAGTSAGVEAGATFTGDVTGRLSEGQSVEGAVGTAAVRSTATGVAAAPFGVLSGAPGARKLLGDAVLQSAGGPVSELAGAASVGEETSAGELVLEAALGPMTLPADIGAGILSRRLGGVGERLEGRVEQARADRQMKDRVGALLDEVGRSESRSQAPSIYAEALERAGSDFEVYIDSGTLQGLAEKHGIAPENMPVIGPVLPDGVASIQISKLLGMGSDGFAREVAEQASLFPDFTIDSELKALLEQVEGAETGPRLAENIENEGGDGGDGGRTDRQEVDAQPGGSPIDRLNAIAPGAGQVVQQAKRDAAQARKVVSELRDNIRRAGIPSEQSGALANLLGHYFESRASLNGTSVLQEFQRTPIQFVGEAPMTGSDGTNAGRQMRVRGLFQPDRQRIVYTGSRTPNTWVHEIGHFILEAETVAAPERVEAFLNEIGWEGGMETWRTASLDERRAAHERFAEAFSRYLLHGEPPSAKVAQTFRTLANVIRAGVPAARLAPEEGDFRLNEIIRRWLVTAGEVEGFEAQMATTPMLDERTAELLGIDEDQLARYRQLREDEVMDAIERIQKHRTRLYGTLQNKSKQLQRKEQAVRRRLSREPVYRLRQALLGEGVKGNGTTKLNAEVVKTIMPEFPHEDMLAPPRSREVSLVPIEVFAERYGYTSARAMLQDLRRTEPLDQAVEQVARQELAETNPFASDIAAEAFHSRRLATELKMLGMDEGQRRQLDAGAKEYAERLLRRMPAYRFGKAKLMAARRKAADTAVRRLREGDIAGALEAKRWELTYYHASVRAAELRTQLSEAQREIARFGSARLLRDPSRPVELTVQMQRLLVRYGYINTPRRIEYINTVFRNAMDYNPELLAEAQFILMPAFRAQQDIARRTGSRGATTVKEMTVDEVLGLNAWLKSLDTLAKKSVAIREAREKTARWGVRNEVVDALAALPPSRMARAEAKTNPGILDSIVLGIGSKVASMRRMEFWFEEIDRRAAAALGRDSTTYRPLTTVFMRPVMKATADYRVDLERSVKAMVDATSKWRKEHGYTAGSNGPKVPAPELNGRVFATQMELIGYLLHTGNPSNLEKMVKGEGWELSDWDMFFNSAMRDGRIQKADLDLVQSIWNMFEANKPRTQRVHRAVNGSYFVEIPAMPLRTPWGLYEGGYYPAIPDRTRAEGLDWESKYLNITTDREVSYDFIGGRVPGFTQTRTNATWPVETDPGRMVDHIDMQLRYIHLQEVVTDLDLALKLQGKTQDGEAPPPNLKRSLDMLSPGLGETVQLWLSRTAKQRSTKEGSTGLTNSPAWTRMRMFSGLGIMALNIANLIIQPTSVAMAVPRVGGRRLLAQTAAVTGAVARGQFGRVIEQITSKSPAMKARFETMVYLMESDLRAETEMGSGITSRAAALNAKVTHYGYAMHRYLQFWQDAIVWLAAYDLHSATAPHAETVDYKVWHDEVVARADADVRMTQSSTNPEDISALEVGSPAWKMLLQFYSFFNAQYNLLLTEGRSQVAESNSAIGAAGALTWVALWTLMVPGAFSRAVMEQIWDSEGGEEDLWDRDPADLAAIIATGTLENAAMMVPIVGGVGATLVEATFGEQTFGVGRSMVPAAIRGPVSASESLVRRVGDDDGFMDRDPTEREIRDLMNALGLAGVAVPHPTAQAAGAITLLTAGQVRRASNIAEAVQEGETEEGQGLPGAMIVK